MPVPSSLKRKSMAGYKPVKAINASKEKRLARTFSQEANKIDEDTNSAEGDLLSEEEGRDDDEEQNDEDEKDGEEEDSSNEEEEDSFDEEDSTYLAIVAEKAEAKKKADAEVAKKAKKAKMEAERRKKAQERASSPPPQKPAVSPASTKKRGRTTNSYKLAKEYITQLENTEDYDATKSYIASALWKEKYADIEASLNDIDFVHEVKVSKKQKDLFQLGVEKHGFNKKYKGGYHSIVEALKREKNAKADSLAAHVEEMALFDLKINYLTVKADDLRKKSGVEADLRAIIERHMEKVEQLTGEASATSISTPSSSKKQRK